MTTADANWVRQWLKFWPRSNAATALATLRQLGGARVEQALAALEVCAGQQRYAPNAGEIRAMLEATAGNAGKSRRRVLYERFDRAKLEPTVQLRGKAWKLASSAAWRNCPEGSDTASEAIPLGDLTDEELEACAAALSALELGREEIII